jgi:catalase
VYSALGEFTRAGFLNDPSLETPVFVRFSTVVGSRGSADTVRDVRGFATRFFTKEGNFDLVGNNIPVFFIQDGIKFPDLVHSLKPEPANEIPQAQSAHDSFWDFVSLVPETAHMVMWLMSDRAIPRSYRMMEGFGVHTFRLINEQGQTHLVKFVWKPLLGAHSLVWDEAQKLAGKDPDFHRRDLWNAIETGAYPEFELCLQIMSEDDAQRFGFDLLDATKVVPEELVPVRRVGRMTLNRNPRNFFAETEQIAFHVGNVVPGIDVTNDPLLQARLFSYLDTQLLRLGGPNFVEIPINRPLAPVHNHQQDGFHRDTINTGVANYHPNSIGGGCPFLAAPQAGYVHYAERVDGAKIRTRSPSFTDYYSQAQLFVNSLSMAEYEHLVKAFRFELGKVVRKPVRERVVALLNQVDAKLAEDVAAGLGIAVPSTYPEPPQGTACSTLRSASAGLTRAPSLSLDHQPKDSIRTRRIAALVANGFSASDFKAVKTALTSEGALVDIVSLLLGTIHDGEGTPVEVDKTFEGGPSVIYDAVFIPGGAASVATLNALTEVRAYVMEAREHAKAIAASSEAIDILAAAGLLRRAPPNQARGGVFSDQGIVIANVGADMTAFSGAFVAAIRAHRHWQRASLASSPL